MAINDDHRMERLSSERFALIYALTWGIFEFRLMVEEDLNISKLEGDKLKERLFLCDHAVRARINDERSLFRISDLEIKTFLTMNVLPNSLEMPKRCEFLEVRAW